MRRIIYNSFEQYEERPFSGDEYLLCQFNILWERRHGVRQTLLEVVLIGFASEQRTQPSRRECLNAAAVNVRHQPAVDRFRRRKDVWVAPLVTISNGRTESLKPGRRTNPAPSCTDVGFATQGANPISKRVLTQYFQATHSCLHDAGANRNRVRQQSARWPCHWPRI